MATTTGARTCHGTIGATHDLIELTDQVNQVALINQHATQKMYAKVYTGLTAAAALAAATAGSVAASDDESFYVAPVNGKTVVHKSKQLCFVALRIIADGATTPFSCHGTQFLD